MMSYPAIHSQGLPLLRMLYHDDERLLSVYYDDGEMISGWSETKLDQRSESISMTHRV